MPIFDYSCRSCGHTFDVLQKLGADALVDCPECGQPDLKKLLSAPAFHLKGKGWRNSDDTPKKPDVRPKFAHTFDSATPHAEHEAPSAAAGHKGAGHSHDHDKGHDTSHDHSHGHGHSHVEDGGGVGRIVREHVRSHNHDKAGKSDSGSSDHGHSHGHSHGHKHDH
jgi:putative FmdB family regulatory protein